MLASDAGYRYNISADIYIWIECARASKQTKRIWLPWNWYLLFLILLLRIDRRTEKFRESMSHGTAHTHTARGEHERDGWIGPPSIKSLDLFACNLRCRRKRDSDTILFSHVVFQAQFDYKSHSLRLEMLEQLELERCCNQTFFYSTQYTLDLSLAIAFHMFQIWFHFNFHFTK